MDVYTFMCQVTGFCVTGLEDMQALIDTTCSWQPADRPHFKKVARQLNKLSEGEEGQSTSIIDKMVKRLEAHTTNLESLVEARYCDVRIFPYK